MRKTMKITLTEDFLVPTEDGNVIFEPGDEIEVEYEDPATVDDIVSDELNDELVSNEVEADPLLDGVADGTDPLTFAGEEPESVDVVEPVESDVIPEENDEVYIEDPAAALV